ncbi:MAG: cupin domain-containing protein [Solirubrobacteraceae bacterium]
MAEPFARSFERPDEVVEAPSGAGRGEMVEVNGRRVGRLTAEPGWRLSTHVKPDVGTESCENEHVGYLIGGRMAFRMDDGSEFEVGPGEVYNVPPGHDAWVVGDEPAITVDFSSLVR